MGGDGDANAARGATGGAGGEVARPDGYPLIRFEHPALPVGAEKSVNLQHLHEFFL